MIASNDDSPEELPSLARIVTSLKPALDTLVKSRVIVLAPDSDIPTTGVGKFSSPIFAL